jgi:hypothetical protein
MGEQPINRIRRVDWFLAVLLVGFIAGPILGSALFGFQEELTDRVSNGARSLFFVWLYPLGLHLAWDHFATTLKMLVLSGFVALPISMTLWVIWNRGVYLVVVGISSLLVGLPNALITDIIASV